MSRFLIQVVLLAGGSTLALCGPASAQTAEAVRVTASALNLRQGPDPAAPVSGVLLRGQTFPALDRRGDWIQLVVDGRRGWSHKDYLIHDWWALGVRWVLSETLNVRTGPDTRYRLLGSVPRGTPVAVVATAGGWARIWYRGQEAWLWAGSLGTAPPSSQSASSAQARSAAGFLQLQASGVGFESYTTATRRWGRPALIYGLQRAAARWALERRDRVGVGDVSLENGGYFPPHSTHQRGIDVDVALPRIDQLELPSSVGDWSYSRSATRRLIELLRAEVPTEFVLFNDGAIPGVLWWPGHDDHFHLEMRH